MCLIQHCQLLFFFPFLLLLLVCFLIYFVPTDFSVHSTRRARGPRLEFNAALLPPLYIHSTRWWWWRRLYLPFSDEKSLSPTAFSFFFVSFLLFFFFCFYLVYRHLFHFDICAWTFGHGSLAPAAYILIPDLRFSISMISYPSVD
jgi:hypothetical protein